MMDGIGFMLVEWVRAHFGEAGMMTLFLLAFAVLIGAMCFAAKHGEPADTKKPPFPR